LHQSKKIEIAMIAIPRKRD